MRRGPSRVRQPLIAAVMLLISSIVVGCGGGGGDDSGGGEEPPALDELATLYKSCGTPERPLRIMPLGDSITESKSGYSSYRSPLWQLLSQAGCSVDFVGSRRGVSEGSRDSEEAEPKNRDFDQDHEGHWDYKADEVADRLDGWARSGNPDIVLLHLGTNDLLRDNEVDSTIADLGEVIDILQRVNPRVAIFLAQVIPAKPEPDLVTEFNGKIPALAAGKHTPLHPVVVVDHFSGFSVNGDTFDGIHPNTAGEVKMADRWMNGLLEVLL